ncbi:MAG: hypothetical protein Q4F23_06025, partial [Coriobacteriia bacterium]|nr:hypothetical protein [Coriobacteriia bacterium]
YTHDDRQRLCRIMTLKYLGLPLSEIAELPEEISPQMMAKMVNSSLESIETEFKALFLRMRTLRELESRMCEGAEWSDLVGVIESSEKGSSFGAGLLGVEESSSFKAGVSQVMVDSWHALIDKAILLMREGVAPDSSEVRHVAQELVGARHTGLADDQELLSIEGAMPPSHHQGDFGLMVNAVFSYLRSSMGEQDSTRVDSDGQVSVNAEGLK